MPSNASPIPLCEPFLGGNERAYVDECISTGWISSVGSFVDRFESEFAQRVGTSRAVAVSSGTAALHLALVAVGVQPNDEVLVSSLTFIAPANAIRYVGAWPVFIDAEPDHWQMDLDAVEAFLTNDCHRTSDGLINRHTHRRVSAILPVHILGHPVDMDRLMEIANAHHLKVVEDAAESLGATVRGRPVGTFGDVGCFSFNGNKLVTTGGGGMAIARDEILTQHIKHLSTQAKLPGNEYIHNEIGFNYRLTNLQAALGCAQLEQIDTFLAAKHRIAQTYQSLLAPIPGISFQKEASWAKSAWWLFTILIDETRFGLSARDTIAALSHHAISARPLWQPISSSPAHAPRPCPNAEALFARAISLPSSVSLTLPSTQSVCSTLAKLAKQPS